MFSTLIITSLLSATSGFAPRPSYMSVHTASNNLRMVADEETVVITPEETMTDGTRPISDPLGLYPKSSSERVTGVITPIEPVVVGDNIVTDPLNMYKGSVNDPNEVSTQPDMSASLPFLKRPAMLDGALAGDLGFDPFGFAQTKDDLMRYRDAEIKHGRLAMLAAAGWPLSELLDKKIAYALNMKPLLVFQDRVPSILNGGLSRISPIYWVGVLSVAAIVEFFAFTKAAEAKEENINYVPGDIGFDPLGLYGSTKEERAYKEESEIFHGRLSMLAITGFAVQEFWTQNAVINETPFFFKPFNVFLEQLNYVDPDLL